MIYTKDTVRFGIKVTVASILLTSCAQNVKDKMCVPEYAQDAELIKLSGDSIINRAFDELNRPSKSIIAGDSLVFQDIDDEYCYSIVSISGDSIITRIGPRGEGPGELLGVTRLQTDKDGHVFVYDEAKQTMYHFNSIDDFAISKDSISSIRFKDMSGGYLYRTATGYIGDNLYGDGHMFTAFDNDGNIRQSFGSIPDIKTDRSLNPDFYMAYQVTFAISPDKKHMCAAGAFHDWLAFFDVSGDTPKLIKEYYTAEPIVNTDGGDENYHLKLTPETINHYFSMAPFNGGVYLNYIGATQDEMSNGNFSNHILRYNWDGELEGIYTMPEKIFDMCTTDSGNELYTIAVRNSEPFMSYYQISDSRVSEDSVR